MSGISSSHASSKQASIPEHMHMHMRMPTHCLPPPLLPLLSGTQKSLSSLLKLSFTLDHHGDRVSLELRSRAGLHVRGRFPPAPCRADSHLMPPLRLLRKSLSNSSSCSDCSSSSTACCAVSVCAECGNQIEGSVFMHCRAVRTLAPSRADASASRAAHPPPVAWAGRSSRSAAHRRSPPPLFTGTATLPSAARDIG